MLQHLECSTDFETIYCRHSTLGSQLIERNRACLYFRPTTLYMLKKTAFTLARTLASRQFEDTEFIVPLLVRAYASVSLRCV